MARTATKTINIATREAIGLNPNEALTSIRNTHFAVKLAFTLPQQTKLDRSAQATVENAKNAHGGYKVRRQLWDKATIAPFNSLSAEARNYLRARTVPMGEASLLSKEVYFEVVDTIENKFFVEWDMLKTQFAQDYVNVLQRAEIAQGDGFDPSVYPDVDHIVSQFTRTFDLHPVGDVGADIFDGLETALAEDVAKRVQATTMRNIRTALHDPLSRLIDAVMNIHNKTTREKSRIHLSVMGELDEITGLFPALNIVGIPELNDMAAKCRNELLVPTESLAGDTDTREKVSKASEKILKGLGVDTTANVQASDNYAQSRKEAARAKADDILQQMGGLF